MVTDAVSRRGIIGAGKTCELHTCTSQSGAASSKRFRYMFSADTRNGR